MIIIFLDYYNGPEIVQWNFTALLNFYSVPLLQSCTTVEDYYGKTILQ